MFSQPTSLRNVFVLEVGATQIEDEHSFLPDLVNLTSGSLVRIPDSN